MEEALPTEWERDHVWAALRYSLNLGIIPYLGISRAKECHSSLILTLVSKYLGESERKVLAIFGFST